MHHKQPVSALWAWKGQGGSELRAQEREMIGRCTAVRKKCHWLPYLKEMRRAEEGGTKRENRIKSEEKERRGILFTMLTALKVSLSSD